MKWRELRLCSYCQHKSFFEIWFLQVGSKSHLKVAWNAIQNTFLQSRVLNLKRLLCHLQCVTHRWRHIQREDKKCIHAAEQKKTTETAVCWIAQSAPRLDRPIVWRLRSLIMLLCWKATSTAHGVTDYIVNVATSANILVMSGHENLWSDHQQWIVLTLHLSDATWETNQICLLWEHSLSQGHFCEVSQRFASGPM